MRRIPTSIGNYLRPILLLLLLAAQGAAYSHEIAHFERGDQGFCATCSIGGTLGAGVTPSHDAPVEQLRHAQDRPEFLEFDYPSRPASHFARAPPCSL